jgi:hypothetical protein
MPLVVARVAVLLLVVLPQMWYARDKGRDESWGLLGALGLLGWLFLWSLDDRGFRFSR